MTALPWDKQTALTSVSPAIYHADPCEQPSLSSSIARMLVTQTPAHARIAHPRLNPDFVSDDEPKFDLGTVAHMVLLGKGAEVEVVEADSWRTNAAKEQAEEARRAGRTPLLEKDWVRVEEMTAAARTQLDHVDSDPPLFADGRAEQMLVWEEDGVTCRCLFDWIHDDLAAVDDYKTTAASAHPDEWPRTAFRIGADIQVGFYLRGLEKALGVFPQWRYVVQENYPPYALSVVSASANMIALGYEKAEHAINVWRRCMEEDRWPGYTREVTMLGVPPWEQDWTP